MPRSHQLHRLGWRVGAAATAIVFLIVAFVVFEVLRADNPSTQGDLKPAVVHSHVPPRQIDAKPKDKVVDGIALPANVADVNAEPAPTDIALLAGALADAPALRAQPQNTRAGLEIRMGDEVTAPDDTELDGRVYALLALGTPPALEALRNISAANPRLASAHKVLAKLLVATDLPEAIRHAEAVVALQPQNAVAMLSLAVLHDRAGQAALAADFYRFALQLRHSGEDEADQAVSWVSVARRADFLANLPRP